MFKIYKNILSIEIETKDGIDYVPVQLQYGVVVTESNSQRLLDVINQELANSFSQFRVFNPETLSFIEVENEKQKEEVMAEIQKRTLLL